MEDVNMGQGNELNDSERIISSSVSILNSGLVDDSRNIFNHITTALWLLGMPASEELENTEEDKRHVIDTLNTPLLSYEEYINLERHHYTQEQIEKILHSHFSNQTNISLFNQLVDRYNEKVKTNTVTPEFAKNIIEKMEVLISG